MNTFWRTLLLAQCLVVSLNAFASTSSRLPHQSYESCGLITSEYLTVLQLSDLGLSADALIDSLPNISQKAIARVSTLIRLVDEKGLSETYSSIYSEYAACSKAVYAYQGVPVPETREDHFYHCAGENKVRYEISMAAIIGANPSDVASQLPESYTNVVQAIFKLQKDRGNEVLFGNLATELKHCINRAM